MMPTDASDEQVTELVPRDDSIPTTIAAITIDVPMSG